MDFAALSTALSTEITTALTDAQPIIVLVLGLMVAWGIYRKLVKGSK